MIFIYIYINHVKSLMSTILVTLGRLELGIVWRPLLCFSCLEIVAHYPRIVSGWKKTSDWCGLTLQKSHINHWGYILFITGVNPLTIRGMSLVPGDREDFTGGLRNTWGFHSGFDTGDGWLGCGIYIMRCCNIDTDT